MEEIQLEKEFDDIIINKMLRKKVKFFLFNMYLILHKINSNKIFDKIDEFYDCINIIKIKIIKMK